MARGRRKQTATLEEKIVEITSEIENMESTLKALKAEKKIWKISFV